MVVQGDQISVETTKTSKTSYLGREMTVYSLKLNIFVSGKKENCQKNILYSECLYNERYVYRLNNLFCVFLFFYCCYEWLLPFVLKWQILIGIRDDQTVWSEAQNQLWRSSGHQTSCFTSHSDCIVAEYSQTSLMVKW